MSRQSPVFFNNVTSGVEGLSASENMMQAALMLHSRQDAAQPAVSLRNSGSLRDATNNKSIEKESCCCESATTRWQLDGNSPHADRFLPEREPSATLSERYRTIKSPDTLSALERMARNKSFLKPNQRNHNIYITPTHLDNFDSWPFGSPSTIEGGKYAEPLILGNASVS